jgi:PD-(D/E)XK nuclease superfamily
VGKRESLDVNYAYQNTISYSQFSMYSSCQYQWYLAYVKKHKVFKPGIHLVFGTSLHEVLQEYLSVMYNESGKAADSMDLNSMLKERLSSNYKEEKENFGSHFSTPEELKEFYEDGVSILEWFKKHRAKYFSIKNSKLIGVEVPLLMPVTEKNPNVLMVGYIDLIMYEKNTDSYTVYDIKTSTRGWGDKEKKDKTKLSQVLFYKRFFSKKMGVPEEKIEVKFFICRRKIFEEAQFPMHRIQEFIPAQGKKKVNDAYESLEKFISECFTEKAKYNTERNYSKNTSSCKYCPFSDKPELCSKN